MNHTLNENTGMLKIYAVLFMLIDHIGAIFFPSIIELRIIGRIALPLFAWCLVVGAGKTRNIWQYMLRIILLAVISQPLYNLALNHPWKELNILFTLALALFGISGMQWHKYKSEIIFPLISLLVPQLIRVDYGFNGVLFILLLYMAKNNKKGLVAFFIAYCLYWGANTMTISSIFGVRLPSENIVAALLSPFLHMQTLSLLALPFILVPQQQVKKIPLWINYGIYPFHLVVLIVMKYLCKVA